MTEMTDDTRVHISFDDCYTEMLRKIQHLSPSGHCVIVTVVNGMFASGLCNLITALSYAE